MIAHEFSSPVNVLVYKELRCSSSQISIASIQYIGRVQFIRLPTTRRLQRRLSTSEARQAICRRRASARDKVDRRCQAILACTGAASESGVAGTTRRGIFLDSQSVISSCPERPLFATPSWLSGRIPKRGRRRYSALNLVHDGQISARYVQ